MKSARLSKNGLCGVLWLLLAAGGLIPALAQTVVPINALPPVLTPVTINNGAGDHYDPHISGDWVAYSSDLSIRYYNIATGADAAIPMGNSARDLLSDISGSKIVFSRVITGVKTAVMMFDASTPAAAPIEIDAAPGTTRIGSAIGGNTVAYIDFGLHGNGELVIHDLASATSVRATTDVVFDGNPSVSPDGSVVTWEHCAVSTSNCDIWQAVKSGAGWNISVASATANPEANPDNNGTLVVYDSVRAGNPDLFWRPILGGGAEVQMQLPSFEQNPSIAGNFIAFESRPTFSATSDIFVYDIIKNLLYQITDTPLVTEQLNDIIVLPDVIRVVWSSDENGYPQRNIKSATFLLNGTGLLGVYYDNLDFTAPRVARTEAVNFDWGLGAPAPGVDADTFSVRWTGKVVPRYSELYRIFTVSDDGVRLWVDGQQIVSEWNDHPPTEHYGDILLEAAQAYDVVLEMYENGSGAVAKLLWQSARQPKEPIPASQLLPARLDCPTPDRPTFSVNFVQGIPTGTAMFGQAAVDAGWLKLTRTNTAFGIVHIDNFSGTQPVHGFEAKFTAALFGSTCCNGSPADGFSFNLVPAASVLPNPGYNQPAEEGLNEGLAVNFDTWDNGDPGDPEGPAVEVKWRGRVIARRWFQASQSPAGITNAHAAAREVLINLTSDGRLTVSYGGIRLLDNVQTPYNPLVICTPKWVIGARNGVANDNHWIRDLQIVVNRANIPGLFNTGVDGLGHSLSDNASDPHYLMAVGPTTVPFVATAAGGFPIGPWLPDNTASAWIAPSNNTYASPGVEIQYETTFNLNGLNPASAAIHGWVAADDQLVDILLNSQSTGQATPVAALGGDPFTSWQAFAITSGILPGPNTVTFVTRNGTGGDNPTGLRVEMCGWGATLPHLQCPSNIVVACTNPAGQRVFYTVTAADDCNGMVPVICTPPSGSLFAQGTTTVNCSATDNSGNTSLCQFLVTVDPAGCEPACLDFTVLPPQSVPNPWTYQGKTFRVLDHTGTQPLNGRIWQFVGFTGLDCGFTTHITLPHPCDAIEMTLANFTPNALPTVTAYNAPGAPVSSAAMSPGVPNPQMLTVVGPGITRLELSSPANETILLRLCCKPPLRIRRSQNDVIISWPISADDWQPEEAQNLSSPNWTPVTQERAVAGGDYEVTLPASGGARFFRLRR